MDVAHAQGLPHRRHPRRLPQRAAPRRRRAGLGLERQDRRRSGSRTAGTSSSSRAPRTAGRTAPRRRARRPPPQVARVRGPVDTVAPVGHALVRHATTLISPNGDGTRDGTQAHPRPPRVRRAGARRVTNGAGTVVRSASGSGGTAALTWNGTDDAGARVPDGRYTVDARRVRRRRQRRHALVGAHGRHDAAGRQAHHLARGLLAQRRRRRATRPCSRGPRTRRRPAPPGSVEGTTLVRSWKVVRARRPGRRPGTAAGPTARASRTGRTRSRWTSRTPRATGGPRPRPSSWTGPAARCAGRATSSRRTGTTSAPPRR